MTINNELNYLLFGIIIIILLMIVILVGFTKYIELKKIRLLQEQINRNKDGFFNETEKNKLYRAYYKIQKFPLLTVNNHGEIIAVDYTFEDTFLCKARVIGKNINFFFPDFPESISDENQVINIKDAKWFFEGEPLVHDITLIKLECFKTNGTLLEGWAIEFR